MATEIYEVPDNVEEIFDEVEKQGSASYRIIDTNNGMDMDNVQALKYFIDTVEDLSEYITEDLGTQITIKHPKYKNSVKIDSGGLGDFFSHGYECSIGG